MDDELHARLDTIARVLQELELRVDVAFDGIHGRIDRLERRVSVLEVGKQANALPVSTSLSLSDPANLAASQPESSATRTRRLRRHGSLGNEGDAAPATSADARGSSAFTIESSRLQWLADVLGCHLGPVRCVTALRRAEEGYIAASASSDKTVKIWDGEGAAITLQGHESMVFCVFSVGKRFVVSGDNDGVILIWDLFADDPSAPRQRLEIPNKTAAVSVLVHGGILVAGTEGGAFVADLRNGEVIGDIPTEDAHTWVKAVAVDEGTVLAVPDKGAIHCYSFSALRDDHEMELLGSLTEEAESKFPSVGALAFARDSLLSGHHDGSIRIWNVLDLQIGTDAQEPTSTPTLVHPVATVVLHAQPVVSLAIVRTKDWDALDTIVPADDTASDAVVCLTCSRDGTIAVYDIAATSVVDRLPCDMGALSAMSFVARGDESSVVLGCESGDVVSVCALPQRDRAASRSTDGGQSV